MNREAFILKFKENNDDYDSVLNLHIGDLMIALNTLTENSFEFKPITYNKKIRLKLE